MANLTYNLMKRIIQKGNYDKDDVMNKLDVFFAGDRITKEEYKELAAMVNPEEA